MHGSRTEIPFLLSAGLALVCSSIALTIWVYLPGLDGPFLFDDFVNLEPINKYGGVTDWPSLSAFVFGNSSGPLGRPLSMLSFLINDSAWPGDPTSYKYTNLLLHAICGLLLLAVVRRLAAISLPPLTALMLAGLVCLFWLLTPLNVSTTLYVIQRMAQLSTLFMLLAMAAYIAFRSAHDEYRDGAAFGWGAASVVATILAVLSKENGALVLPVIAAMELTVFRQGHARRPLPVWCRLVLFVPALAVLVYPFVNVSSILVRYELRPFTPSERLLTEARILWDYAYNGVVPNLRGNGLFHDDYQVSRGLLQPWTTVVSLAAHILVMGAAWVFRKRVPLASFGVCWWYIGHVFESTMLPLELYFEHRNYFPLMGLLVALGALVAELPTSSAKKSLVAGAVGLTIMSGFLTSQAARTWRNSDLLAITWAAENPASARAQRFFADYLRLNGNTERAIRVLEDAWAQHPGDPAMGIRILDIKCTSESDPGLDSDSDSDSDSGLDLGLDLQRVLDSARRGGADRGGVLSAAELLSRSVLDGRCQMPEADLHRILHAMEDLQKPRLSYRALAKLKYTHADVFIHERRLEPALRMLDEVFALQPTVDVAFRQAVLLASGGLVDQSLERVEVAERLNRDRKWGLPDRGAELARLRDALTGQQGMSPGFSAELANSLPSPD